MSPIHYQTMARYNAWANGQVFDAAARLPDDAYRAARPAAYFGSLHGTLNHVLVVDLLWFARLDGSRVGPLRLDQILHDDLAALRAARAGEDARIVALVDALDEEALAKERDFKDTRGDSRSMPVWQILATVFNHQTHHRGQAHALLKDAGLEPPSLDLPVYLRSVN